MIVVLHQEILLFHMNKPHSEIHKIMVKYFNQHFIQIPYVKIKFSNDIKIDLMNDVMQKKVVRNLNLIVISIRKMNVLKKFQKLLN